MRFAACFLAFMTGFLSLSQEVLWVRLFSFVNHSLPQAFSFVLLFYLFGIAIGAWIGKKICLGSYNLWQISGAILVGASFFDLIAPWVYAEYFHTEWQLTSGAVLILLTALFKAIIFPIAHQLGTPVLEDNTGRAVSRVYVSNILGATLGPIIVGMVFLHFVTTQQCYVITAVMTFLIGCYCLEKQKLILSASSIVMIVMVGLILARDPSLLIAKAAEPAGKMDRIIETKQGIVTLYKAPKGGNVVFGGNVYDGRTNLDPIINSNSIDRIIVLAALQEKPQRVLMIGLSIGTWLKLVTSFSHIKHIDVIEINPGYLKAIKNYPAQQSALLDPRVHLYIDDGRRWLKIHPLNQYDLVIMNTTYHWRAYSSNLLSKEFLTLIKQHMQTDAVLAFNSTGSPDVLKTATSVFSHAYLYKNFVIAANFDWREKLHRPAAVTALSQLQLDGKLLFPLGGSKEIKSFLSRPTYTLQQVELQTPRALEVITDYNLITEYKYGMRWH